MQGLLFIKIKNRNIIVLVMKWVKMTSRHSARRYEIKDKQKKKMRLSSCNNNKNRVILYVLKEK